MVERERERIEVCIVGQYVLLAPEILIKSSLELDTLSTTSLVGYRQGRRQGSLDFDASLGLSISTTTRTSSSSGRFASSLSIGRCAGSGRSLCMNRAASWGWLCHFGRHQRIEESSA